jgi:hypothetical protein
MFKKHLIDEQIIQPEWLFDIFGVQTRFDYYFNDILDKICHN